jgi:ABC-type glycerol-3-phosphate transport system substrate-binding protein
MRRYFALGVVVAATVTLLAGCSGDDGSDETTTTTTAAPITTISTTQAPTTTAPAPGGGEATTTTTTTVTLGEVEFPAYSIAARTGEAEDTVVVLMDLEVDDALTDIDLQNLLADVVDNFPPVTEAYVVSSSEAVDLVLAESVDDDGQAVLDQHFWARLEEGFRIVFEGPFAGEAPLILGS